LIKESKQRQALHAMNEILIQARKMAYEKVGHEILAEVFDYAEELPMLMARDDDQTGAFREALVALANKHRAFTFAVERFDRDA
jgi:hypothetical protein